MISKNPIFNPDIGFPDISHDKIIVSQVPIVLQVIAFAICLLCANLSLISYYKPRVQ